MDELKVDRSFAGQMDDSSSDAVIVRSTIDLGHHLGRPMPAADLEHWLERPAGLSPRDHG